MPDAQTAWRELSPDFERYVTEFLCGDVWSRDGLELHVKSLCTIAVLAALGRTQGLELNIRMALGNGATPADIKDVFLQIAPCELPRARTIRELRRAIRPLSSNSAAAHRAAGGSGWFRPAVECSRISHQSHYGLC